MTPPRPWWPSVSSADLRHQVEIQAQTQDQDAFNQVKLQWNTVRTCYARIDAITVREAFGAEQITSEITHAIYVRWTETPLLAGMRVVFGSHIYKIQVPDDLRQRHIFIRLLCLELNGTSAQ